jgi:hypothetical protein
MYIFAIPLLFSLLIAPLLAKEVCDPDDVQCSLRNDERDVQLVRARPEENATLPCSAFLPGKVSKIEWWFGRRSKLIMENEYYSIGENSSLLVSDLNRHLVEE